MPETGTIRILEVGCGSGQATRLFATLGQPIYATDLSPALVAVARQRLAAFPNVQFGVGGFEQMTLPARAYDLLVSAQAFHWVDLAVGLPKAHRVLATGGTLALFWNFTHYDADPLLGRIRDVCLRHVPGLVGWPDASEARFEGFTDGWLAALRDAGTFTGITSTVILSTLDYSHDRFQQLLTTYSWVQSQPPAVQAALLHDIAVVLREAPDPLSLPTRTLLVLATNAADSCAASENMQYCS
ncbi:MAG: class I SAM-dependent methyltransferase [Chloroflexota bacterium]